MKKYLLLILSTTFLFAHFTDAQTDKVYGSFSAPSEWRKDSTWNSHWNSTMSEWQRDQRIIRTFNSSGMMRTSLIIQWDYLLSEWINYEKSSTEYYQDNTTPKYGFRMKWDQSDQAWVEVSHTFYDNQGRTEEYEVRVYDPVTNEYTGGTRTNYTFTATSTEEIKQILDAPTQTWKNFLRSTITKDLQGNPTATITEVWSDAQNVWVYVEKYEFTYTQSGQILEMIMFLWDNGIFDWKNNGKMTYEYNSSGWLINNYIYLWNELTLDWDYSTKILFHYDESGHQTQAEAYDWNVNTQSWENDSKQIYSYYPNGNQKEIFWSIWIQPLGKFMDVEYTLYREDGNTEETWHKDISHQTNEYYQGSRTVNTWNGGLLEEKRMQELILPGNIWRDSERLTNTYDGNQNLVLELWQRFDTIGQSFINTSKNQHFFSSFIGIEENNEFNRLCFFRNPVRPGETIHCSGLKQDEIYYFSFVSQTGQIVFEKSVIGAGSVTIPGNISTGTYILMITGTNGTRITGKVMVVA